MLTRSTVGRAIYPPCVVTLRCTRETFLALDLRHVEPQVCLKTLNGSFEEATELAPVYPIVGYRHATAVER